MSDKRPAIPRPLYRAVLMEAGYRCAIPTCRQHPVEVEHIVDWSIVQKHEFENLIALCPTCHARKGDKPGQIDRTALRQYKANLAVINSRYGDFERRMLDAYAERRRNGRLFDDNGERYDYFQIPGGMDLLVHYLVRDGYLTLFPTQSPLIGDMPLMAVYRFTDAGREFVDRWVNAQVLDPVPTPDR